MKTNAQDKPTRILSKVLILNKNFLQNPLVLLTICFPFILEPQIH